MRLDDIDGASQLVFRRFVCSVAGRIFNACRACPDEGEGFVELIVCKDGSQVVIGGAVHSINSGRGCGELTPVFN